MSMAIIIRRHKDPTRKGSTVIRFSVDEARPDETVVRRCKPAATGANKIPPGFGRLTTRPMTTIELGQVI